MGASAARIRPAEIRTIRLKPRFHPQPRGSDPQPPAYARTLQAGGHRFDPVGSIESRRDVRRETATRGWIAKTPALLLS